MNNSSVKLSTDDWELSAKEIADIIWLALHMEQSKIQSSITNTIIDNITDIEINVEPLPNKPSINNDNKELETNIIPSKEQEKSTTTSEGKAGIYPQNQGESNSGLSLKVPDAVSIPEPLNLARKLKPLMRRIASDQQIILDEEKTAEAIASNQGLWFPVFKPSLDLWLDLELVIDQSVSMLIWRQTIKELERLLKNYGVFRDVRIWGLTDKKGKVQIHRGNGISLQSQVNRSYKELVNSSGRCLILVVSDGVSPFWRSEKMTTILEYWTKQGFMAIIQMLPQWMWERTSLGWASEVKLKSLNLGTFNKNLIIKAISTWDELEPGAKVPIFTLEPEMVEKWVQMLIGKSNVWNLGYLFPQNIDNFDNNTELFQTGDDFTAKNRVQIFRATASPVGRKLASLLAAAPVITLPIVRLIQRSLLKESLQVNVAEVFLGGLLKPLSEIKPKTNPNTVEYSFIDGVRDLLLDHLPENYVLDIVNQVSEYIADKMGLSLDDFVAVLKQEKIYDTDTDNSLKYFATVTAQILRRLGGKYEKFAQTLNDSWQKTLKDNQENDDKIFLYQHGNTKIYSFLTEKSYWNIEETDSYKKQLKQLHKAILSAFPQEQELEMMIRYKLNERLNQIAFGDTYQDLVFNLIEWSKSTDKLDDLIRGSYMTNPGNDKIKTIYKSLPLDSRNKHTINFQIKTEPYGTYEIDWEIKREDFEATTIGFKITEGLKPYNINSQVDIDGVELLINVKKAIEKIINFIQKENKKTLFLPLLGVGASNLPVKNVATTILSSIIQSLNNLSSNAIEKIIVTDSNEDNIKIINDVAQNLFNKNSQDILKSISLKTFQFKTVTVNSKGKIIKRENQQAQYFTEILPDDVFLDMVYIRYGEFIMGGSESEKSTKDEFPRHEVEIEPFFMGKYPVTQAQYEAIMGKNPSNFIGKNRPVEKVTWNQAVEFCEKLSKLTDRKYSLPSEAQWEYAGRAGTTTPFYFGETITSDLANYNGNYRYAEEPKGEYREETTDVGIFPPNTFGLYDIHGNVWEWCQDTWHDSYQGTPNDGSPWISDDKNDSRRRLRGGSWHTNPKYCRVANRYSNYRADINLKVGFRVSCEYDIDNNYSNIPVQESQTKNLIGQPFKFETVTLNRRGFIIKREQKSEQYFREILPGDVGLDLVEIPGGKFIMGSPANEKDRRESEGHQHEVTIQPFFMGKYLVTQSQYKAIMGKNPSEFKGENRPVERVSWEQAVEFCEKLSKLTDRKYSLPSEAQWEYAGRAGTTTPFYFGETITSGLANYNGNYRYAEEPKGKYRIKTTDVGIFPPNAFGLYDIHGNVREWCQDTWHDSYKGAPNDGSAWVSDDENYSKRILRGGSWNDFPNYCRVANRYYRNCAVFNYAVGFRVSCEVV